MSKITFRADDELIDRLERLDGSKSEIMRNALREYLDARADTSAMQRTVDERSLDELIEGRVDAFIERRLHEQDPSRHQQSGQDVNVNVTLEQGETDANTDDRRSIKRNHTQTRLSPNQSQLCRQCGEAITGEFVFCPNCGEKASHRAFCECGDEIRSDWAHCPGCGRRTPSADVLDRT